LDLREVKRLLDQKYEFYDAPGFIKTDPVSIPHGFDRKEDIEIAGLFSALIAWGNRKAILNSAALMMQWMDHAPYEFTVNASVIEFRRFEKFVYRTFNGDDMIFLLHALRRVYKELGGLEEVATGFFEKTGEIKQVIIGIRNALLAVEHLKRSEKHLANPEKGSAAKRFNMFLRWMIREDTKGVDFGLWKQIPASALMCPLDVHSGNVARKLGLLTRKQNDWKAVEELTLVLRQMDGRDPVKYDYALFGMGVFEGMGK
jgi:uncharacterized protein (TIGR02757 family)